MLQSTAFTSLNIYPRLRLLVAKCFFVAFGAILITNNLLAEGSKELSASGGSRAYLFSSNTLNNASFPFPTLGTMKVYVKAGESIYVGSSAQGISTGTINLRSPDGNTYTSGTSTTVGLIQNRAQEQAGALPNAGGYTPFIQKVLAGQDGVWEIDFIAENLGSDLNGNPPTVPANANWTQPAAEYITAFDISVRNAANTAFVNGRAYTQVFSGILGTFNVGFNAIFHILTKDGYQYILNNNGQAGNGFTFFVNNKGFRGDDGKASYKSINGLSPNINVQDPRAADTETDITQKIFFNTPAADLPETANTPGSTTTWLLRAPVAPVISNVTFTGAEGTPGKAGTSPLGGNFNFNITGNGTYLIALDINKNGVYTDAVDRKLTGQANAGDNQVFWDGLDGNGNKVPATSGIFQTSITIATTAGEVHFPFFDVERNVNGLLLTRINGTFAPNDTLYWDDSPITVVGTPSNPVKNLSGLSSAVNGHKWGTPTTNPLNDADFGNNKCIDTWSYIKSKPVFSSVSFETREADLSVESVTASDACSGQVAVYKVVVKNSGPDDVSGGQFSFGFPATLTGVSITSVSTTGVSASSGGTVAANSYRANIDIANGATRTFTVSGNIAPAASGDLSVTAGMLRPADVTDPDATNPDSAVPTDAANECDALPSGVGCNNIKTNIIHVTLAPNAGPDQTIFQYAPATMAATGTGTWTQVAGDASPAIITSATNATTTITGLDKVGLYHFLYTNVNGCADTIVLKVISADLQIPNIITPNNDGKNDVFKIVGLESYPGSQLLIFNRWGNEVYRADNYKNDWNGSGLAEATYYYILNRKEHTGEVTPLKGWVFLKLSK
ncbi:gliding motility-associated C-terminal domain-containing protein [Mucilaginibacter flavus]|uniref:T9SS type B sorting domain-containing protein n=1 Tax=Mucilaginibacter flavus TaxID=931504 RepID=UPI0025B49F81|nr:gliding motility-associated C-terminal domain-containing protein [Mucilaginibacter flavus]MDN3581057.1 gliding motility-associated C-terminal domain-containing protein [Mucilaginibacter flavus]